MARRLGKAATAKTAPAFAERSELCRYIDELQRLSGNRPAPAAFMLNPGEDYLSVNLLGVETIRQIAAYYRVVLQRGGTSVAISKHKLAAYNAAAKKAGLLLAFDAKAGVWNFTGADGQPAEAYKLRVVAARQSRPGSPSHAGVEYLKLLDDLNAKKFARRMVRSKFHMVTP
jgi:hypothetical protein